MRKGKPKFELPKGKRRLPTFPEKEAPAGAMGEDKSRHVCDPRDNREGFSLCGCVMNEVWGRKPLDPWTEFNFDMDADDLLKYIKEELHGCQKCVPIWINLFL